MDKMNTLDTTGYGGTVNKVNPQGFEWQPTNHSACVDKFMSDYGFMDEFLQKNIRATYLITGASGFIGKLLIAELLKLSPKRIVCFSRSESKQAELKQLYPEYPDNIVRFMIGDIRDQNRLIEAMTGVDYVIHAAALKRVEVCAYDVQECMKTNIGGCFNVIEACIKAKVKKCIFISSDKAVSPITTYGKSKAFSEDLFIQANNLSKTRFCVARYANVRGSTGSILTIWDKQFKEGKEFTITDMEMTRMWIDGPDAAAFVVRSLNTSEGGEIFIPKCDKESILELLLRTYPNINKSMKVIGLRPSEKLHEELITGFESKYCYDNEWSYIVYPYQHDWVETINTKGTKVADNFTIGSKKS